MDKLVEMKSINENHDHHGDDEDIGHAGKDLGLVAFISLALALAKGFVFLMSGSLVVLSSFFDSFSDAIISFVNSRMYTMARQSADKEHPFGHGGYEVLSALIQGTVMMSMAAVVLVESTQRLFVASLAERLKLGQVPIAFFAMIVASLAGWGIQIFLGRSRKEVEKTGHRSLSLNADQAHYAGDALMNGATAIGLAIVWYSGVGEIDALFGIVGAFFLVRSALPILKHSIRDIVHYEIDPELQQKIVDLVHIVDPRIIGVHRLRSRELGPVLFVDFHLKLPRDLTLEIAHEVSDEVSRTLKKEIPRVDVIIHLDPDSEPDDDFWRPGYKTPLPSTT